MGAFLIAVHRKPPAHMTAVRYTRVSLSGYLRMTNPDIALSFIALNGSWLPIKFMV